MSRRMQFLVISSSLLTNGTALERNDSNSDRGGSWNYGRKANLRRCIDNQSYRSEQGLPCKSYSRIDCKNLFHVGLPQTVVEDILFNCPQSCKAATCRDLDLLTSSLPPPLVVHSGHSDDKPFIALPRSKRALEVTSQEVECNDVDNPFYKSPQGGDCSGYQNLYCMKFSLIGFTVYEEYDLINNCPESCNIPCGTFTLFPSMSPSATPTVSSVPSISPSLQPSNVPSDDPSLHPSPHPSWHPSSQPSVQPTAPPTSNPSDTPSLVPSLTPSSLPSKAPSVLPSGLPSIAPSLMPSSQPTDFPSNFPTFSPSALPSVEPSFIPSLLPSATLSDVPSVEPSSYPSISTAPSPAPSKLSSFSRLSTGVSSDGAPAHSIDGVLLLCTILFVAVANA